MRCTVLPATQAAFRFPLARSFLALTIPGVMPRLQPVAEHLWVAQFPLNLKGVHLGRQMTVVRLPDEHSLVLLDPGPLDDEVQHEIARIGNVRHIVAPSLFHDTFVQQALRAYQNANFHAPPGFEKVLQVDRRIRVLGEPIPDDWQGVFQQELIGGMPMVNEVVTHHIPSGTLIVADLVFNIPPTASLGTKLFMRLNGAYPGVKASRMIRLTIRDRAAHRASLDRVLRWNFDRLIPSHGMMVESGGYRALELAWKS
jgi:hypothetical protein